MGFTKTGHLIRWLDLTTRTVKLPLLFNLMDIIHHHLPLSTFPLGVYFFTTHRQQTSFPYHIMQLASLISDCLYLDTPPFDIQLIIPPSSSSIDIKLSFCPSNIYETTSLPFLHQLVMKILPYLPVPQLQNMQVKSLPALSHLTGRMHYLTIMTRCYALEHGVLHFLVQHSPTHFRLKTPPLLTSMIFRVAPVLKVPNSVN